MKHGLVVRMTAPLVCVSALLLVLGTVSAWYVYRLQENASETLASNVASVRAAEELEIGLREIRTQINDFLLTGDHRHLASVRELRKGSDHWLSEACRLAVTEPEERWMEEVQRGYKRFFVEFEKLGASEISSSSRGDLRTLVDAVLTRDILQPAHAYLDFNEQIVEKNSLAGRRMASLLVLGLLVLGICGPAAGLLAGFVMARRVSRTLIELSVPVHDAAGRLSEVVGPISAAGRELDELPALLQDLATRVATVVGRLQQSQCEVLRSEQLAAVGQLAAGVAHELRNPLQSMQLLVQSAMTAGERGCLRGRDLSVLQEAIDRVKRSVQTFLDFARPPALAKEPTELREVVRQTVELVMGRANRQGVRIESHLPPNAVTVDADVGQVRQVVLNLLLNAIDAVTTTGMITVCLQGPPSEHVPALLASETRSPSWVTLEVSDDGCGLPADLGDRIFDPFVTTKDTGTGLGLAICRRIVEAHGGQLQASNRVGPGATFTVRLPSRGGSSPTEAGNCLPTATDPEGAEHADPAGR